MDNFAKKLAIMARYQIGLVQAVGVVAYITLFILMATHIGPIISQHSDMNSNLLGLFGPALFLITFVTSALITGSIVLAYPAWLTFKGQPRQAIEVVGWTILWLITLLFCGLWLVAII